jgi:hypothetical protein
MLNQNSNGYYRKSGYDAYPISSNGNEFVLSDYACDTIYTFNAGKLAPFVVPVNARESEDVAVVFRSTRYSVLIVGELGEQTGEMKFNHTMKLLGVDHRNGDIFEIDFLNGDFAEDVPRGLLSFDSNNKILPAETAVIGYSASELVDWRDAGKLKGPLAEIATTMKEDDNHVLMFMKFKK